MSTELKMETIYECLNATSKHGYEVEYFWVSGVTLVAVGVFGFTANIFNIIVLCRQRLRRRLFYNILAEMAIFDLLFILTFCICAGVQSMACTSETFDSVRNMSYPLANVGLCGSIYATVAVSIERFLSISNANLASRRKVSMYTIPVVTIALTYNGPRFFYYKYSVINGTLTSTRNEWADSKAYETIYTTWLQLLVESVIPILFLLIMNVLILRRIYFSPNKWSKSTIKKRRTTIKILLGLFSVVLCCRVPTVVVQILSHFGDPDDKSQWYFMKPIEYLAVTLNSSLNFLIYCYVGTEFRDTLVGLCQRNCSTKVVHLNNNILETTYQPSNLQKETPLYVLT